MSHVKRPPWGYHQLCHGGSIPNSDAGRAVANAYQYHKNWRQLDMVCRYSGKLGSDFHGGATNDFYVITPVSTPSDSGQTTRKYALLAKRWNYDFWVDPGSGLNYTNTVDLNGSQLGSYTVDVRQEYTPTAGGTAQSITTPPKGPGYVWIADLTQSLVDSQYSSGYRYDILSADQITFAGFAAMSLPEYYLSTGASQGLVEGNFFAGHTLRGYTSSSDTGTSIGSVVHNTDNSSDGVIQNTKNCVMNYMHPAGNVVFDGSATAYHGLKEYIDGVSGTTSFPFKVKGKNLRNRTAFATLGSYNLDLCICAQWDTGAKMRVTSAQTGITVNYNFVGSSVGTPSFVVLSAFVLYDPRGDELSIEFEVSPTKSVIVHSLSLFEVDGDEV